MGGKGWQLSVSNRFFFYHCIIRQLVRAALASQPVITLWQLWWTDVVLLLFLGRLKEYFVCVTCKWNSHKDSSEGVYRVPGRGEWQAYYLVSSVWTVVDWCHVACGNNYLSTWICCGKLSYSFVWFITRRSDRHYKKSWQGIAHGDLWRFKCSLWSWGFR